MIKECNEIQMHSVEDFFDRSLTAHMPSEKFKKLQETTVLMGGVGGGSNVAELLARKGVGHIIISDIDVYECHNIRQRGSVVSSLGKEKVLVMEERLRDVNPHIKVTCVREGITCENAEKYVDQADIVVDLIDLHALDAKVVMHRAARKQGKYVLTAPSVINGAVMWIFSPDGDITFEEFFNYVEGMPMSELAWNHLLKAIPRFPSEELKEMYKQAAHGTRSIPLDAVGVEQASIMLVTAIENILFGNLKNIVTVPKGLQVDLSRLQDGMVVVDQSQKKEVGLC